MKTAQPKQALRTMLSTSKTTRKFKSGARIANTPQAQNQSFDLASCVRQCEGKMADLKLPEKGSGGITVFLPWLLPRIFQSHRISQCQTRFSVVDYGSGHFAKGAPTPQDF
ncbi:hypothetical protein [Cupriavidus basilensis]|uniref:hypothetical protein n=1 Tax=Cupriavidus basilensis TaxID=68895 RepID=UPI00157AEC3B|nr:hypothetical protein [Cupriavidus basilensis]NUA32159.1 hypothetical protein [Cupriavidus basilensis]